MAARQLPQSLIQMNLVKGFVVALAMVSVSMGHNADKKQVVTIGMDVLDCPVCFEPFKPPIFQITYFNKKSHEQACSYEPCFCPDSGCGFSGSVATLWKHFTTQHKWPSTEFKYYTPFDLRVKPGAHFLRAGDGQLFVMNMVSVEPVGHGVSLVCIQPNTSESSFRCNVVFSSFTGHHQISTLESVRCSSLSDGLPKNYFCIVPKSPGGGAAVLLRITIDTKLVLEVEDEQEEEEDDDDYDEDEDEDDESDDEDGN
ncbi:hypothetical protein OsI_00203 [Oryza sativa Indica Group]|uniref:SIAH-type domain-containing protein n=2 Tax=Oryza sativa TaxID=4530 RepID=A2ZNS0_ORYSJ|nr:hypothetical protein OsI_00203 [Oryza sativa Indica Group]EAZ10367.1 hypothetical protein OsJ_00203 [Oryza sativa Japonica Group]